MRPIETVRPEDAAWLLLSRQLLVDDLPKVAAQWIAAGIEADGLVEATITDSRVDPGEVREQFVGALRQLGMWYDSVDAALEGFLTNLAFAFTNGELDIGAAERIVATEVDFDDLAFGELSDAVAAFGFLCWLGRTNPEFDRNGGMVRLRQAAEAIAAR